MSTNHKTYLFRQLYRQLTESQSHEVRAVQIFRWHREWIHRRTSFNTTSRIRGSVAMIRGGEVFVEAVCQEDLLVATDVVGGGHKQVQGVL